MSDELVRMPLATIVAFWRPGSRDWPWSAEYADVMQHPRTANIMERANREGIGFLDDVSPVLLGNDGRVWDGHHRICIAIKKEITHLMVDVVPDKGKTDKDD